VQISSDFGSGLLSTGEAKAAAAVAVGAFAALTVTVISALVGSSRVTSSATVRRLVLAVLVAAFAAQSLFSGHHLDLDGPTRPLATVAHSAHLAAVFIWMAVVTAAFIDRSVTQLRRTRVAATWSIAVLLVAGPLLSYLLIAPTGITLDNNWILLFAAKVAAITAAAVIGWVHHRRSGSISDGVDIAGTRRWVRTLGAEIAVFVTIAALSATLTMHRPPALATPTTTTTTTATATPDPAPDMNGDKVDRSQLGNESVALTFSGGGTAALTISDLTPAVAGTWVLTVDDVGGNPVAVDKITVEAANVERDVVGVTVTLLPDGPGRYVATHILPVPGRWQLHLSYLADQFTLEHAMAAITAPAAAAPAAAAPAAAAGGAERAANPTPLPNTSPAQTPNNMSPSPGTRTERTP
jgi:putative copper export protein